MPVFQRITTFTSGKLVPTVVHEERFKGSVREVAEVRGKAFLPYALPPKLDWDRIVGSSRRELIAAERALARLNGRASKLPNPHLLLGPFARREARLSSLIEDTVATPKEIALAESGVLFGRDDPKEIANYIFALNHGLDSPLPLCNRLFKEMHEILLRGVRGGRDLPGHFRREQNYIGKKSLGFLQARFVPPPHGEILERCMADLEQFVNGPHEQIPELVSIALGHYQFECIHPFRDGNGRLGRLIMTLSLCKYGLLSKPYIYVSEFFSKHEEKYKDLLLRVSTEGAWEAWIRFVLEAFAVQARAADIRADAILCLQSEYTHKLTGPHSSSLLIRLCDHLFSRPVITIDDAEKVLGVTKTAARRHVATLVKKGILDKSEEYGKAHVFVANGIIAAAETELSSEPQDSRTESTPNAS